jgi:AAHS family 4-hydroxybenzoate transporter-like MFS transporter
MSSSRSVVDVQTFINEQRFGAYQRLMFFMCFVIILLDGIDTAAIGFIAPALLSEWHVAKPDLAPVMSAALFGLAFGSLTVGPLSDRFGRRIPLICSVLLFGVICLISATAGDLRSLTIMRFIMGIGLGAAIPNSITLLSEFCPEKRRGTILTLLFSSFGGGTAVGGFIAAYLIPNFGWRSMLIFGGVMPLLLLVLIVAKMPESVRFMVAREKPHHRIQATLGRISDSAFDADKFVQNETAEQSDGIAIVMSKKYVLGSVMLWITYFMGLVIVFGMLNWMPILLKESGMTPEGATLVTALFPVGGFFAWIFGMLMDRFNATLVLSIAYLVCGTCMFLVGQTMHTIPLLVFFVMMAGWLVNSGQSSMPAIAAAFYPTAGRGTGVSWMLGVGRFGGVAGSFLVAELTRRNFTFEGIFTTLAMAGVIACVALLIKMLFGDKNGSTANVADRVTAAH